jgi:hypothetical protein
MTRGKHWSSQVMSWDWVGIDPVEIDAETWTDLVVHEGTGSATQRSAAREGDCGDEDLKRYIFNGIVTTFDRRKSPNSTPFFMATKIVAHTITDLSV